MNTDKSFVLEITEFDVSLIFLTRFVLQMPCTPTAGSQQEAFCCCFEAQVTRRRDKESCKKTTVS
jgi:hypothetical protein